jgi:hypothetical protein
MFLQGTTIVVTMTTNDWRHCPRPPFEMAGEHVASSAADDGRDDKQLSLLDMSVNDRFAKRTVSEQHIKIMIMPTTRYPQYQRQINNTSSTTTQNHNKRSMKPRLTDQ